MIRQRLPVEVHRAVFAKVLAIAQEKGLLKGGTVAVDSTTLEANAAMKSIVRKDSGEDWKEYVGAAGEGGGLENPTAEELRKFDRKRKGKKASNDDWQSPSDPDARIAKMKNGDTHLAYKAEHAVDLETEMVVAAPIYPADQGDAETLVETLIVAQENLRDAGSEQNIEEVVADKGYHTADTLADCAEAEIRTYIPERKRKAAHVDGQARGTAAGGVREPATCQRERGANDFSDGAANGWSAASPTCARPAERGAVGSADSWR